MTALWLVLIGVAAVVGFAVGIRRGGRDGVVAGSAGMEIRKNAELDALRDQHQVALMNAQAFGYNTAMNEVRAVRSRAGTQAAVTRKARAQGVEALPPMMPLGAMPRPAGDDVTLTTGGEHGEGEE